MLDCLFYLVLGCVTARTLGYGPDTARTLGYGPDTARMLGYGPDFKFFEMILENHGSLILCDIVQILLGYASSGVYE